jgi:hypothetical protein
MSPKSVLFTLVLSSISSAGIDFAHEVVPLLQKHCVECHGGEESKGGFSMNTRAMTLEAGVIEPGEPEDSILMELVLSDDEDERMPPPDDGKAALTEKEVDVLSRWITAGVPWEEGVSFAVDRYEPPLKPRNVDLPQGSPNANPLDLLVERYAGEKDVSLPEPATDEVFLRRLWLDIIGLPPGPEVLALLKAPGGLDRAAAVDMALADATGYAEHWMTFWNDLLRNAYNGPGYTGGSRSQITGWLYQSLYNNKPYDQFVRELIAPDESSQGFIDGIQWRGRVNASQTREIQFSQNISQAFLGINMKCASCHDSFVDRWTLKDAYSLAAIYSNKQLELTRCDIPTGEMATPGWIFPELGDIDPKAPRAERLKQLAGLMTHPENGRMQRTMVNRLWDRLMGRGIVHPVDAMNSEPWDEDLLDYLANHFVTSGYDLKAVLRLIATSRIYQAEAAILSEESGEFVFRGPIRKRLTAEQFIDSIRTVIDVWPEPGKGSFENKSGKQGGQLSAVMKVHGLKEWDDRPVRAGLDQRDTLQAALGRPSGEQIVSARPDVITTLEAINLANGPELSGLLGTGAEKLLAAKRGDQLVDHVFLNSLSRLPSASERRVAKILLGNPTTKTGVEDLLWSVFMLPEFLYVN